MRKELILGALLIFHLTEINSFSQVRDYWPTSDWQAKAPEESGMNTDWLGNMQQTIESSMPYVDAFLIVKNGFLVFEKYYNTYNKDKYHILCSSTKSITSILIGMLLKQHMIDSPGEKIMNFFPEYAESNDDPRLNQLTIEHMLTFTAGITNNDDVSMYQSDIIRFYLSQPFFADPGEQFKYATPASHMLSAFISKKTGKNAREFANEELFPKLGISNFYWPSDGLGYSYGGHNSWFCPRDMLKFGFLYLNHGIWDGDTLVDPEFVSTSTIAHSEGGSPHHEKYGYNWWITENNGYHAFFAGGYGGQFIYVVPDLDLVVAITCRTDKHREDARFLINDYVVPSILGLTTMRENSIEPETEFKIFPNPASGEINIEFELTQESNISLFITDMKGIIVATIIGNQSFFAGWHSISYAPELQAGCYNVIYQTEHIKATKFFTILD